MKNVSATEFARNFREFIDRVEMRGEEFVVIRNDREVARVSPSPIGRAALDVLPEVFNTLPAEAGRTWEKDARRPHRKKNEIRDPWAT